jgi:hypothetical protein
MGPKANTGGAFSSPERTRAERKIDASEAWAEAIEAGYPSNIAAAIELGISESLCKRYGKADEAQMPPLADALGLRLKSRISLAQSLIGARHAVVELPEPSTLRSSMRLAAAAHREHGETIAAYLEGTDDGRLDAAEGERIERECDEEIAVLLAIRAQARLAQRERVIGVPREEPVNIDDARRAS